MFFFKFGNIYTVHVFLLVQEHIFITLLHINPEILVNRFIKCIGFVVCIQKHFFLTIVSYFPGNSSTQIYKMYRIHSLPLFRIFPGTLVHRFTKCNTVCGMYSVFCVSMFIGDWFVLPHSCQHGVTKCHSEGPVQCFGKKTIIENVVLIPNRYPFM